MQKVGEKVPKHVETNISMRRTNVVRIVQISIGIVESASLLNPSRDQLLSVALPASHLYNDFRICF